MAKTREHVAELRLLGDREMLERLSEARRELFNLRFQLATGQLDNSSRLGAVRRDIARLATFLREREIAAAEAAAGRARLRVVVPVAPTGPDSAAVVHMRRKSWTGGLPLLHSAGKRQSKVDSRRSPQSKPVDGVGNAAKVSGVCLTNGRRTEIAIPPGLKPTSFLRCFRHPSTSLRAG